MSSRNEPCWCGSGVKYKRCHAALEERLLHYKRQGYEVPHRRLLKTPEQIAQIRESARINNAVLDRVSAHIGPGMSTAEIDQLVETTTRNAGAIPAQLGYKGFPRSVCVSINDVVCHGIPSSDRILQDGDIVNVDVSTEYNGYYADASRMYGIGEVGSEQSRLIEVVRECVAHGIEQVIPWQQIGNVGAAISDHAALHGYSVVEEVGGHGIGLAFHEEPWVGFATPRDTGMLMVPGMIFTIEPMINQGTAEIVQDEEDGWTIYTADGQLSAQCEVMVLVTESGCEVLAD